MAISGIDLSVSLYLSVEVRDITFNPFILVKFVKISSATPSQNHFVSFSLLISLKGKTAMEFSLIGFDIFEDMIFGADLLKNETTIAIIKKNIIKIFNRLLVFAVID